MIKVLKFLRMFAHLFSGVWLVFYQTRIKKRSAQNPEVQARIREWFAKSCHILGITINQQGEPIDGPVLFIANHVSWLDIPLVASVASPRFLSKSEISSWPVIGWLARKVNTLFIVRGDRTAAEAASAAIVEGLEEKSQILIFPEGTTTDGKVVGRLHARLFGAPIKVSAPVQPIVIHYTDNNTDAPQSERVPYIGKQTLIANLWAVLGCKDLNANVYFLPAVETGDMPRKELANTLQTQMQITLQKSQAKLRLSH